MKWLDVSTVRLPERAAMFTVHRHDVVNFHEIIGALNDYRKQADLEVLEASLRAIVTAVRPELAGCTLWAIEFDMSTQEWAIGVLHESLPSVSFAAAMPRIPLVPAQQFVDIGVHAMNSDGSSYFIPSEGGKSLGMEEGPRTKQQTDEAIRNQGAPL